jgi:hypothetical protein
MSLYQFAPSSLITQAQFRYADDHLPEAVLTASDTARPEQLSGIRQMLDARGWHCVPVHIDGHNALQLSGFGKPEQLLGFMNAHQYIEGQPVFTSESGDDKERSTKDWLYNTSLKASGWSYIIGDVALLMSGLMSGRQKEAVSGALYTAGGAVLARYGNVKTEHHVRDITMRMGEFLKKQADELPPDCALGNIMKEKRDGVLPDIEHFLYKYPAQTTVGIYTLGAFSMLQSGLKHGKFWDIAYGANSTAAGLGSIIIPEKAHNPDAPTPTNPVAQCWDWVREKPLRMAGYAYILSGLALGMSAYREFKDNPAQKSYIFKFITTGTYLVGDVLLAISHKDHTNADGKFDVDEQRRIEAMAAEAISRQPESMRDALVHHVAGFLAMQPEMKGKAPDIGKSIKAQLQHMLDNPWSARPAGNAPIQPNR